MLLMLSAGRMLRTAPERVMRFYVNASLHVSASIAALAVLTRFIFRYEADPAATGFIFLSSIVAYNLAKYSEVSPHGIVAPKIYLQSRKRQLIFFVSCLAAI